MGVNKKYYYLKLKDNFYNEEDIKILESMPNGYEYSSLYLKLCLLSLKGEGKLLYKNRIPYKPEMLATITNHKLEVVDYAIDLFVKLEMVTILDNGTIFIDDMHNLIGHGSTEAERKAQYRKKIASMKELGHCPDKRPPEIEIEIEKEKELDSKKDTGETDSHFSTIWELYDKKVGKEVAYKSFKKISKSNYDKIIEHIKEYVKAKPDKKYRKNLSTYLNQKSWEDEIIYDTPKQTNSFWDKEEENRKEVFDYIDKM